MTDSDRSARTALVTDLSATYFVEAAAGTGKTHELVQRAVALLASGRAFIERLAIITFTEKAAGELALRLREALDRGRAGAEPAASARLEAAIARLEDASIDTIHGFCREILRAWPVEAGIDPDFSVEGDPARLVRRVFRSWLADQLSSPPPGLSRYLTRGRFGKDETPTARLESAILDLLEHRDFRAAWDRPSHDLELEARELASRVDALAEDLAQGASDDPLRMALAPVSDVAEWLRAAEQGAAPEGAADRRQAYQVEREARLIDLGQRLKTVLDQKRTNRGSSRLGYGPFAPGLPRPRLIRSARDLGAKLRGFTQIADQDLAAVLREELLPVVSLYEALAKRAGRVDFHALLSRTRDLLKRDAGVRQSLQARFSHILVDEFQDTDPLQAEIILLLSADDPSEADPARARPLPGKLTLVGDPKQSIFGFRRADLATYAATKRVLTVKGVKVATLGTSHRALAPIQAIVNEAFGAPFSESEVGYVPLAGGPPALTGQPSVVALPAPRPFDPQGQLRARAASDGFPEAVGAFVSWLVNDSGWRVRGADGAPRPVEASDVCLLFRNLQSYGQLVVAPFQEALEAHGIDHVLVGARTLYDRDELESLLTALFSLEWPDDELSVYGALRGPYLALQDHALFTFRDRHGPLHPFRKITAPLEGDDHAVQDALELLRALSGERNRRPFVDTVAAFLRGTRALVGLGLRPGGPQILAHVDRVFDLARSYEAHEGLSFRGFLERLREEMDRPKASEGAVNEESAAGVRIMTVHKAKGLEFPVVVLADPDRRLRAFGERVVDTDRNLAAFRLAGLVPKPVVDGADEALAADQAESLRLAYVACTRARDLLVIPTVGFDPKELVYNGTSWLAPLLSAIYPLPADRRSPRPCPGAPSFGEETYIVGPDTPPRPSVKPGLHKSRGGGVDVAWWDPAALPKKPAARFGIVDERYLAPEGHAEVAVSAYADWRADLDELRATAREQSVVLAELGAAVDEAARYPIAERALPGAGHRPGGRRFGQLVHRAARDLDLEATRSEVEALVGLHARSLRATDEERAHAVEALAGFLSDALVERARRAVTCLQGGSVVEVSEDGTVVDVEVDLLFEETAGAGSGWVALDLVTGAAPGADVRRKMTRTLAAIERSGRAVIAGVILRI